MITIQPPFIRRLPIRETKTAHWIDVNTLNHERDQSLDLYFPYYLDIAMDATVHRGRSIVLLLPMATVNPSSSYLIGIRQVVCRGSTGRFGAL